MPRRPTSSSAASAPPTDSPARPRLRSSLGWRAVALITLVAALAGCGPGSLGESPDAGAGAPDAAPAAGDPAGDADPDLITPPTPPTPQPKNAPDSPPSSAPPPPEGAPPVCDPGVLTVRLDGADAFTGHRLLAVAVRNGGDEACLLAGYPELAFRATSGEVVDATVTDGDPFGARDLGPQQLVLAPGGEAFAVAGWDAMSTTLDPDVTTSVLLTPPGAANPVELPVTSIPGYAPGASLDVLDGAEVTVTAWTARLEDLL